MPQRHRDVIRSIESLIEAHRQLREALRNNERMLSRAVRALTSGSSIDGTFTKVPTTEARSAGTTALDELVGARHEMRVAVFRAGLAEGMSIGELSRRFNFSRQLGSRYAREAGFEG